MKKLYAVCAVTLLVAGQAVGMQVTMETYTAGAGGYYRFNPDDTLEGMLGGYVEGKSTANGWYGSFCLENNEYFKPGQIYDVSLPLDTSARKGGVSGATSGADPICWATAYLFEQFATGNLGTITSGVFVYGQYSSASALQNMIWWLEGELPTLTQAPTTMFDAALSGYFKNEVDPFANYTGDSVRVLNLYQGDIYKQDQLAYVRTSVPDPASTLVLLGLGLAGVAAARRKLS